MKRVVCVPVTVAVLAAMAVCTASAFGQAEDAAPVLGGEIPAGYREWV